MAHYFKFRLPVLNKVVRACKLFRAFSKESDFLPEPSGRDRKLLLPRAALNSAHTVNTMLEREGHLYRRERIKTLSSLGPSSRDTPQSKSGNLNLSLQESHKYHFLDPFCICTWPLNQDNRDK